MRTKNLPLIGKIGVVFLVLYLAMLLFAPFPSTNQTQPYKMQLVPTISQGTLIDVNGYSSYDAYDRVVSIMDGTTEVGRIITPLHRTGLLPNTFNDVVTLPYSDKDALSWQMPGSSASLWNVKFSTQATSSHNSQLISLIAFQEQNSGGLFDITITTPGTVYILVSGHSQLESVNLSVSIDNQEYQVYNWHPLNDDAQLTTTGMVIPYIAVNMTAGMHFMILTGSSQFDQNAEGFVGGVPYFFVSAFEVTNPNVVIP